VRVSRIETTQNVVRIYVDGTSRNKSSIGRMCSGCILLRTEVAKINGWRAHSIDFNCMTSSLGSTQLDYPQCLYDEI